MYKNFRSAFLASCALFAIPAHALEAKAQGQAASQVHDVNLSAQPLSSALRILSRQTGIEIVFRPELVRGQSAPAVSGRTSTEVALQRLLSGTGLAVRYSGETAILYRAPAATRQPVALTTATSAVAAAGDGASGNNEIIVQGSYSASIADALDRKRKADNVVDSIEAVDIAQFPNQNIAESLQRLPGVTIERDRGEGLFVKVRGLGPNFQVTLLNGQSIAVNENVRDSGQNGRQFRFDTIPSELIAGVDVMKSPSADLEEGAIGGIVNIRTFKPMDLESGTVIGTLAGNYVEKADTIDPNLSGLASWKNDSETLGLLIAGSYSQRTLRQDRITGVGWEEMSEGVDTDGDGIEDTGAIVAPSAVRPTLEQEDRKRYAVNAALQFAPSDAVNLTLEGFYTRLDDHYDELTYSADIDVDTIVPGSAVIEDGALISATTEGKTQIGREVSDMRHQNWFVGLSGDVRAGDWTFHPTAYVTRAVSETSAPITRTRLLGPVGLVKVTMPKSAGTNVPSVDFLEADLENPGQLPFRRVEWRDVSSVDKEHAFGLATERPVDFGPFSRISMGAKYRDRSRDYDRRDVNLTSLAGQYFDGTYFDRFPFNDFLAGTNGSLPTAWVVPDPDPFWNDSNKSALSASTPSRSDLRNSYSIGEEITSAFAMANFDTMLGAMPVRGNMGLRYAHTRQTSAGYADDGTAARPVSYTSTYDDFLPSANLVIEPARDLIARFAMAKVITRPSLSDLAPRLTLNSSGTIFEARGGNPELQRFQAWQYDAGLEYYFAPGSVISASVFYKDIGTFVYNQVSDFVVDGQTYMLTAPTNGGDASVKGLELAFQHRLSFLPAPLDGLGLQANYTLTDSKASYSDTLKDDLANIARHSYNLTGFYENGPFEAWVSYSWRGKVLQSVGTNDNLSINDSAFGSLDASISLKASDHLKVSLQGINVTNAKQRQFVGDNWFGGYTDYGRTVRLTARMSL
ncbi:TonB-dependent receptor [Novosphingobium pentaromativorans]|uniref:TonB-dependent receptor n=1 Tax=Novosphingobium pentaromativorans US6-1 TaxID=1088721 RepID=G6EFY0_9SPHN|nr:TonB-dependent receptor [Novosphingobium pentaromativorans]AIT82321.1 TonB-dependent receptor [Novosphingobium pentaromativorans US6-1]EHJ59669.1 TonB-dependent receptor [Novosphingobium pentaromativorans US6-1]